MLSTAALTVADTKGLTSGFEKVCWWTASAKIDVKMVFCLVVKSERKMSLARSRDLRNSVHRDQERLCWDCVFLVVALLRAASEEAIR